MKHAILILAHKDFDQVRHLIDYFKRDCYVYVHIDRKAAITEDELRLIDSMPQVRAVYRKYKVHWGGFSILKTELFLLRQVLKDGDCDYVHLISGQDYPIKPLDEFLSFFEKNKGKEYIRFANIPNPKWDNYSFARFQYYYPYDFINKNSADAINIARRIIQWERKLGIKRRIPDHFEHLYGSSQWFSITKEAAIVIVNYTKRHPAFYNRARWTFASEEYYIATVLVNLMSHEKIIATDLRFIRWKNENGNCPANLGPEHFHCLAEMQQFLFARKIDYKGSSSSLIPLIDKYLINDSTLSFSDTGAWIYDGIRKYDYNDYIAKTLAVFCKMLHIESAVDVGCGAGFYVAALRRMNIPVTGFDSNPYTRELSSLLLPQNDIPCEVLDISYPIEIDDTFEFVYCISFTLCIPQHIKEIVFKNISLLSYKYICLVETEDSKYEPSLFTELETFFLPYSFRRNTLLTGLLNERTTRYGYKSLLLEKFTTQY